jgi:hypothetical protein
VNEVQNNADPAEYRSVMTQISEKGVEIVTKCSSVCQSTGHLQTILGFVFFLMGKVK